MLSEVGLAARITVVLRSGASSPWSQAASARVAASKIRAVRIVAPSCLKLAVRLCVASPSVEACEPFVADEPEARNPGPFQRREDPVEVLVAAFPVGSELERRVRPGLTHRGEPGRELRLGKRRS